MLFPVAPSRLLFLFSPPRPNPCVLTKSLNIVWFSLRKASAPQRFGALPPLRTSDAARAFGANGRRSLNCALPTIYLSSCFFLYCFHFARASLKLFPSRVVVSTQLHGIVKVPHNYVTPPFFPIFFLEPSRQRLVGSDPCGPEWLGVRRLRFFKGARKRFWAALALFVPCIALLAILRRF